jgi:hypothetical protein
MGSAPLSMIREVYTNFDKGNFYIDVGEKSSYIASAKDHKMIILKVVNVLKDDVTLKPSEILINNSNPSDINYAQLTDNFYLVICYFHKYIFPSPNGKVKRHHLNRYTAKWYEYQKDDMIVLRRALYHESTQSNHVNSGEKVQSAIPIKHPITIDGIRYG